MRFLICAAFLTASAVQAQPVTLQLHFDPAAIKALAKRQELVVVSAYFYGEPAPHAVLKPDEMDQIYLGGEELTLWPKDQTVTLGQTLASGPVDQVVEPYLNVNIYSARRSSKDNLLDCTFLDDTVATLSAAPQDLTCKMLK